MNGTHTRRGLAEKDDVFVAPWFSRHEALQQAEFWVPVGVQIVGRWAALAAKHERLLDYALLLRAKLLLLRADNVEAKAAALLRSFDDCSRLPTVTIAIGGGYSTLPPPSYELLQIWLEPAANISPAEASAPAAGAACDLPSVFAALSRQLWQRASPTPESDDDRDDDRLTLTEALEQGLRRRLGQALTGPEETVFLHLVALETPLPGIQVCTSCRSVFRAARARHCGRCRGNMLRPKLKPWHSAVHLCCRAPAREQHLTVVTIDNKTLLTVTERRSRTALYEGSCSVCSKPFSADSARQQHCPACATSAARSRRSRAGRKAISEPPGARVGLSHNSENPDPEIPDPPTHR